MPVTILTIGMPQTVFIFLLTSAVLAAVLANDIVCLAFTPVLTLSLISLLVLAAWIAV